MTKSSYSSLTQPFLSSLILALASFLSNTESQQNITTKETIVTSAETPRVLVDYKYLALCFPPSGAPG